MSLYRDYRPQTFADVVGQDHIVTTLTQAVKQGKVSHAYLFSGPRGTGKTSVARILARNLLTDGIEDPTLRRQIEESIDDGTIVDLVEIDAASNRGIDDIRNLLEKLQFSPVVAKVKVHIIDEVHMLTREAFNALLKTLEEPPPYAYFILATTELHKVPATIQSRCQRFAFRQIPEEEIIQRLQFVADKERIQIDRTALRSVAHHVGGGMRDALSLLEQLRTLPQITLEAVEERIGDSGHDIAETLLAAVDNADADGVLAGVAQMEERALPAEQIARMLLTAERSRLHEAIAAKQPTDLHLTRLEALLDCLRGLRGAPVPSLVMEATLLSFFTERREVETSTASSAAPKPKPAPPKLEKEKAKEETSAKEMQAAAIDMPGLSLEALRDSWDAVLKAVEPASVRMSLKNGTLRSIEGQTITIAFSSNFHREKVAALEASRAVEHVIETMFKTPVKLHCTVDADSRPTQDEGLVNLAEAAAEIF